MAASGPEVQKSTTENAVAASSSNSTTNILLRDVEAIAEEFKTKKTPFNEGTIGEKFLEIVKPVSQFDFRETIEQVIPLFKQFPDAINQHNKAVLKKLGLKISGTGDNAVLYVDIDNVLLAGYSTKDEAPQDAINYPLLEILKQLKKQFPNLKIKLLSSMSISTLRPANINKTPLTNAPHLNPRAFFAQIKDYDDKPLFDSVITTDELVNAQYCQDNNIPLIPGEYFQTRLKPIMELLYDENGKLRSTIHISPGALEALKKFKEDVNTYEQENRARLDHSWYPKIYGKNGLIEQITATKEATSVETTNEICELFDYALGKFAGVNSREIQKGERSSKHYEKARLMDWDLQCHPEITAIATIDDTAAVATEAMVVAAIHDKAVMNFTPARLNKVFDHSELGSLDKFLGSEMRKFAPLMQTFLRTYGVHTEAYQSQLEYWGLTAQKSAYELDAKEYNQLVQSLYPILGVLYYASENDRAYVLDQETIEKYINEIVLPAYNKAASVSKIRFFFSSGKEQLLSWQDEVMKAAEHYSPKALLVLAQMLNKGQFLIKNSETGKIERIQKPDPEAAFWLAMLAAAITAKEIQSAEDRVKAAPWIKLYENIMRFLNDELKKPTAGNESESEFKLNQRSPEEVARQQLSKAPEEMVNGVMLRGSKELNDLLEQHDAQKPGKTDESSLAASSSGPR